MPPENMPSENMPSENTPPENTPPENTERETLERTTHRFEAEVEQVLRLVVHSLYSNKEIFLRELLSNASDALDKLRFRSLTEPALLPGEELRIRIEPDPAAKTLTIWDDGIGMAREDLVSHLGTIAKSGSRELLEKLRASGDAKTPDLSLIGQFGVGFYSAFLVADRVDVISRAAGTSEAWRWSSDAKSSFTLEPATRDVCGTSVVLHLHADHEELLRTWKLEQLVHTYSDFLQWPIEIRLEREKKDDAALVPEYRRVNRGAPLWMRPAGEVTAEEHAQFYEHLTKDWEKPLAWRQFKAEGATEFAGILYLPRRAPFDLFSPEPRHGVRLHVKRVFIMEDCDEVLPRWLRFVRGVIDSEDLPLNVSREILQDSRLTKTIRKQVVRQALDMIGDLAGKGGEDYALFWKTFGAVLKEGLHYEPDQAERIAKLLRYETSTSGGALVSLAEYKARMKEGQTAIYYVLGESKRQIVASPHLEGLKKKGFEVLYMSDPVDGFAVQGLTEFEGVPLVSASGAKLDLESAAKDEQVEERFAPLRARARARLQDHVAEVRMSARLTDSPACLVIPEGGIAPHLERLLRASQEGVPQQKRILELNPDHPLVGSLADLLAKHPEQPQIDEWIDLLFEQSLIAEGTPIEDPGRFTRRITTLLADAVARAASS